jgi:hypothetical protein
VSGDTVLVVAQTQDRTADLVVDALLVREVDSSSRTSSKEVC